MAKLINGQITSIDSDIVADLETLLFFLKCRPEEISKEIDKAVTRVSDYLETYKLDEPEDGN